MPKKIPTIDSPVFTIKLQKGLADLHRLPFADVITVLEEVRQMIADMGRDIEHDLGIENPIGEFGLQLLASPQGVIFKRGSIEAQVAITSNVDTGILAAKRVVDVINSLSNKKAALASDAERSVVRRLNRINKISERDKTELHLVLTKPGEKKPLEATFNAAAAATAWSLQAPVFEMEGTTIYGKLFELRDTDFDGDNEKGFWGELCRENGEKWRIHFKTDSTQKATALFRKQVAVTGTAKYYRIKAPKLIAADITADEERDYEKAFEELFGRDRDIYGDDFQKALKEMRGEE